MSLESRCEGKGEGEQKRGSLIFFLCRYLWAPTSSTASSVIFSPFESQNSWTSVYIIASKFFLIFFFIERSENRGIKSPDRKSCLSKPISWSCFLKELCHAFCYVFKKLKRFSHPLNFKNNGQVLLFKTLFRYLNCFLSPIAMDGTDAHGLNLKKLGQRNFFKFQCFACKNH